MTETATQSDYRCHETQPPLYFCPGCDWRHLRRWSSQGAVPSPRSPIPLALFVVDGNGERFLAELVIQKQLGLAIGVRADGHVALAKVRRSFTRDVGFLGGAVIQHGAAHRADLSRVAQHIK